MSAPLLRRTMAAALKTLVHRRVPAQAQAYVIEVSVRRGYPGEGTFEKGGGAVLALVWQDLAIGEPAGIINADVQALPANAVMAMDCARPPPSDTVTNPGDATEFLGIDVRSINPIVSISGSPCRSSHRRRRPGSTAASAVQSTIANIAW